VPPPAIAAAAVELYTFDVSRTFVGRPLDFRQTFVRRPLDFCPTFLGLPSTNFRPLNFHPQTSVHGLSSIELPSCCPDVTVNVIADVTTSCHLVALTSLASYALSSYVLCRAYVIADVTTNVTAIVIILLSYALRSCRLGPCCHDSLTYCRHTSCHLTSCSPTFYALWSCILWTCVL
jgi:hypothetical protein